MIATLAQAPVAIAEPAKIRATKQALSPDFLLIAACCRWPASDERTTAIRAAAKEIANWTGVLRVAKRHRVAVQVRHALGETGVEVPSVIAKELDAIVERHVRRGLKLAAETVRLQALLTTAGIPNLVLKGAALEQLAYGSIAVKETRDIDLLVPPECAEAALQLIERDGHTLSLPAQTLSTIQRRALIRFAREVELVEPRKKIRVELQWRTADNPVLLCGVDAHSTAQTVVLSANASIRTLAPDDLFAYLCVHGAHHSWSRLKWLADLNALIASTKPDLEHLSRHAQTVGAGYCAGQALLLCQKLFALQLSAALARDLQASKKCQRLVGIAMAAMERSNLAAERDTGMRGVVRELRNQFLLGDGWAFYTAQCRLAYAGVADIIRFPLPRPLHFIYPLLRLPLWLWRRAKFAFAPL